MIKVIPGGPTPPDGCTGSATNEYLYLESINTEQNYSSAEFAATLGGPNHQFDSLHNTLKVNHPGPNDLVCDAGGAMLTSIVYTVTSIHAGPTRCIPAHDGRIDCGEANFMASQYNLHATSAPLPLCHDDCLTPDGDYTNDSAWFGTGSLSPGGVSHAGDKVEEDPDLKVKQGAAVQGSTGTLVKPRLIESAKEVAALKVACVKQGGVISIRDGKTACTQEAPSKTTGPAAAGGSVPKAQ